MATNYELMWFNNFMHVMKLCFFNIISNVHYNFLNDGEKEKLVKDKNFFTTKVSLMIIIVHNGY